MHDLLDQVESVLGAFAETDERYVRPFPRRHGSDVLHFDLSRDHLVPESGDDGRDERQAILALVRDQNTQMIGLAVTHPTAASSLARAAGLVRLSCPMVLGWILALP